MEHIRWQSIEFPDKSTYEGLSQDDKCHIRGVMTFSDGSYYAGEFKDNEYSGFGTYTWQGDRAQVVYRGEWRASKANGCGVRLTKQKNGKVVAEEGEFVDDEWLGSTKACSVKKAREAAKFADVAGQMANAFKLDARETTAVKPKGADALIKSMNAFRLRKR